MNGEKSGKPFRAGILHPMAKPIAKELLEELYCKGNMSTVQIGRKLGLYPSHIHHWMEIWNIPRRSLSDANLTSEEVSQRKLNRFF